MQCLLSAMGNAGGFVLSAFKNKRAGAVRSPEVAHQHHVKLTVSIHICIPSTREFEAEEPRVQGWDWREDSADKVL